MTLAHEDDPQGQQILIHETYQTTARTRGNKTNHNKALGRLTKHYNNINTNIYGQFFQCTDQRLKCSSAVVRFCVVLQWANAHHHF